MNFPPVPVPGGAWRRIEGVCSRIPRARMEEETVIPRAVWHKGWELRTVVYVTCVLAIVGSLLIMVSYILFKDIRTKARLLLFHLSLTDLGVAVANLVGGAAGFENFYINKNGTNGTATLIPHPGPAIEVFCKAQAFVALFSTISSVLWTCALAMYMYFLVLEKNSLFVRVFVHGSYVICYGLPVFVCIWAVCTKLLDYSPYNSSGWCALSLTNSKHKRYDAIFSYDIWIVTTMVLIVVVYVSTHYFVRQEVCGVVWWPF